MPFKYNRTTKNYTFNLNITDVFFNGKSIYYTLNHKTHTA
ncbi:hypothetical protein Prede_2570 [Prevotella dentalis DSM 3688]|uniref:Plasmid stabilization protein n=1 Tax=Prevotella dentalis (strain ATCC 49559 / DSM 3688 / JCM 13448 / NCTC 12043 / ES 2772) TaxID=908937 RepID=F9D771_PREDD|nr:hypothetical protein Prede_2519 [Prevotella dentalis DSM 3688]AGB29805.1 hypothetical protein Prede_2570 [Prevotella dentalis DSM 3688]EGQ11437.1 plasmid stabilization protein [Prevotella dentalis DSM 3688]